MDCNQPQQDFSRDVSTVVNPTDTCNWFILSENNNYGMIIGEYPTKDTIQKLLDVGVNVFVNLCTDQEINRSFDYCEYLVNKHKETSKYGDIINSKMPMITKRVPNSKKLYDYAMYVYSLILQRKLVYVHSMTGHGRASMLAAYTMMFDDRLLNINTVQEALEIGLKTRKTRIVGKHKLETKEQYRILREFPDHHRRSLQDYEKKQRESVWNKVEEEHVKKHGSIIQPPGEKEVAPSVTEMSKVELTEILGTLPESKNSLTKWGSTLKESGNITEEEFLDNEEKYGKYMSYLAENLQSYLNSTLEQDKIQELDELLDKYRGIQASISDFSNKLVDKLVGEVTGEPKLNQEEPVGKLVMEEL